MTCTNTGFQNQFIPHRVLMLDRGLLVADLPPAELLDSPRFAEVFGVEPDGAGWTLRPSADPQSSR